MRVIVVGAGGDKRSRVLEERVARFDQILPGLGAFGPRSRLGNAERAAADGVESRYRPQDPFAERSRLGPLASKAQVSQVMGYIQKGIDEGAKLVAGGLGTPDDVNADGFYVRPTVFSEVSNQMTIAQEEIFGPVLSIIPFDSEEQAVEIANDSPYGLSGGVWSANPERAKDVALRLRAGQVEVNGGSFNPSAPFGGYKQSGYGRELGPHGYGEFLQTKSLQL